MKIGLFNYILFISLTICVFIPRAQAFWLLNFQTASTLPPKGIGFIGGTGGQYTSVGNPPKASFTPFLAHAGIRYGLTDGLDVGYRLCTVPLPYASVGPSLGSEVDFKLRLLPTKSSWQMGLIGGVGYANLLISGDTKDAWAPGADLVVTHSISKNFDLNLNARYVDTLIASGPGGSNDNNVQSFGGSVGARFTLTDSVSAMPEVGLFDFQGKMIGVTADGWGLQYGAVLSARIF